MALCAYHEDTESEAVCVSCKSPICAKCRDYGADGMCGMCLEMSNARRFKPDVAAPSADPDAQPKPRQPTVLKSAAATARSSQKGPKEGAPPGPRLPVTRKAAPKNAAGKRAAAPTGTAPRGNAKGPAWLHQTRYRLYLIVTVALLGSLGGFSWWSGQLGADDELQLQMRQHMGMVKAAVLTLQERTGNLPTDVSAIETQLRLRGVDPEGLVPPLRMELNPRTPAACTVLLRQTPEGLEIRATDGAGAEVTLDDKPHVLVALKREVSAVPAATETLPSPGTP